LMLALTQQAGGLHLAALQRPSAAVATRSLAPSVSLRPFAAPLRVQALRVAARRVAAIHMQEEGGGDGDDGKESEKKRGRTAVIARPKPKTESQRKEEVKNEQMWKVLLHDDDVHTWDYVIYAIVSVVKTISRKKAHKITTQVHTRGMATVTVSWKQMAKTYCLKLQEFGLTSSISPAAAGDEKPEGGGGGGA